MLRTDRQTHTHNEYSGHLLTREPIKHEEELFCISTHEWLTWSICWRSVTSSHVKDNEQSRDTMYITRKLDTTNALSTWKDSRSSDCWFEGGTSSSVVMVSQLTCPFLCYALSMLRQTQLVWKGSQWWKEILWCQIFQATQDARPGSQRAQDTQTHGTWESQIRTNGPSRSRMTH